MTQARPKPGEKYRHFKGKLYQVLTVATQTETGEELVVYQALYGDFKTYARPLEMFLSQVDREKYPDSTQDMRFQRLDETSDAMKDKPETKPEMKPEFKPVTKPEFKREMSWENSQNETEKQDREEMRPKTEQEAIMYFLDLDTFAERWNALSVIHEFLSDRMVDTLAAALDVVIPEGNLEDRYSQLRSCISTMKRFESNR